MKVKVEFKNEQGKMNPFLIIIPHDEADREILERLQGAEVYASIAGLIVKQKDIKKPCKGCHYFELDVLDDQCGPCWDCIRNPERVIELKDYFEPKEEDEYENEL